MSLSHRAAVLSLLLAGLVGCHASPPPEPASSGEARLTVQLPETLPPGGITRVTVTVSAPDMSALDLDLVPEGNTWSGVLRGLPVGAQRTFLARAFDASQTPRYEGSARDITVSSEGPVHVSLTLREASTPPPLLNEAPLLDSLSTGPTRMVAGGRLSLSVRAHDPNPEDTLSYTWSAPSGHFSPPTGATTTWIAPSTLGPVDLTLTVSDSRGASLSVGVTVQVAWAAGWTLTGATRSRFIHQATLLPDGRVLIAGGYWIDQYATQGAALDTAEVYDPATGTWSPTGSLHTAREVFAAVLLPGGKVLAVGGQDGFNNDLSSVELYDPATGTWSPAAPLLSAHHDPTATRLSDGRVLVVGGYFSETGPQTAELYDPSTDTWSPTRPMVSAHYGHTATLLSNGQVLVMGGYSDGGQEQLAGTELYEPATDTWRPTDSMSQRSTSVLTTLLPDGEVLATGSGAGGMTRSELYDPVTGTWRPTGSMTSPRQMGSSRMTLLSTGKVLVSGGYGSGPLVATCELYDPATGTWSPTGELSTGRSAHTATLLRNGQVLVVGGLPEHSDPDPAELYTP